MVFELIQKSAGAGVKLEPNCVSVTKSGFSFGANISKVFSKPFAEIYVDMVTKKVAFKQTDNRQTGYRVGKSGRNVNVVSKVVARISKGVYTATLEKGMLIVKVPEITAITEKIDKEKSEEKEDVSW